MSIDGWWLCWKKAERNVGVEVGVVVEGGKRGRGFQVMWELEGGGNSLEITAIRSNDLNSNHASSDLSPLKKGLLTLLRVDICFVILLKSQG